MSKLKVNELDTKTGTTITVAAGKTLAGTDIIGQTQIANDAVGVAELSATGTASGTTYLRGDNAWSTVPAGAPKGGGSDKIFFVNGPTVTTDYTVTANDNAMSAGPVSVDSGINVTLTGTSEWVIV